MLTLALALSLSLLQQSGVVVWEDAPPEAEAEASPAAPVVTVPDWARADPYAYERARCNPMIRGDKPLETCQAEVRATLYAAMGNSLPESLRPVGTTEDCQMMRNASGGSAYGLQCGPQARNNLIEAPAPEQDCRPRPDPRGGFTSECRPVTASPAPRDNSVRLKVFSRD